MKSEVFERVPEFARGVLLVWSATNAGTAPELESEFRARIETLSRESYSRDQARIDCWSDAYKRVGMSGKSRPSVERLLKRIGRGQKPIPFISPLVCISNLVSLSYVVPSGLVDLDKVHGSLVLGRAKGTECFEPFGDTHARNPKPGELILYDTESMSVFCASWNSQGGRAAPVMPETQRAIMDVDILLTTLPRDELANALKMAALLAQRHCGARTSSFFLSKETPRQELLFE